MDAEKSTFQNSLYNLAGSALPLIIAVLTIPFLIKGFGKEMFGILSLAWVLIGYFSLADFGMSRALTKSVSESLSSGNRADLPAMIWTSLLLMTTLGVVGAVVLALISPLLVREILKIETTDSREVLNAFYLLSIGITFTVAAAGLRGILEALMRFDLSSYIRTALGVFNFAGPALVLPFSKKIVYAVIVLVLSRALSFVAYLWACLRLIPELRTNVPIRAHLVKPLIRFGGWITVSNIISPIMVNFDRFFIGAIVTVSALAYYSTPWEVVARLLIIPTSIAAVVFPTFSRHMASESVAFTRLYRRSTDYIIALMFPFCLLFTIFAREILNIWLGSEFAVNSFRVLQIMGIAVLLNGLALIPFSLIQASGRPDITAKFHSAEVILYIPVLWLLIKRWGIIGAAIAWLIRVTIDLVLLEHYAWKKTSLNPEERPYSRNRNIAYLLGLLLALAMEELFSGMLPAKIVIASIAMSMHAILCRRALIEGRRKVLFS